MANIQTSNITQYSFLVNWNYDIPFIENQELFISGGPDDRRLNVIREQIQATGSKLVSNLEPGSEYTIIITTNTNEGNGVTSSTEETLIVKTLEVSNDNANVTASQQPTYENNTVRNVVLFLGFLLLLLVGNAVRKRMLTD